MVIDGHDLPVGGWNRWESGKGRDFNLPGPPPPAKGPDVFLVARDKRVIWRNMSQSKPAQDVVVEWTDGSVTWEVQ